MAKRIYLQENGLTGLGPVPTGYKEIGYNGVTFSERYGLTSSTIGGYIPSYKEYVCLISHSGIPAEIPTVSILSNTLGVVLTWIYDNIGSYYTLFNSDPNKTYCIMNTPGFSLSSTNRVSNITSDGSGFYIITAMNGTRSDGLLYNTSLEIRIYN